MVIIREILMHNPEKHTVPGMPAQHRIIIRSNTYGSNFAHFQLLFNEAKKDFPHITPEKADIFHYGGTHYKGTYGLEFNIDVDTPVPNDYKEVSSVEYKL